MTPTQTHGSVIDKLNAVSHRRNQIVHEGDLRRPRRPQRITRSQLPGADADADWPWIGAFLTAVDTVR